MGFHWQTHSTLCVDSSFKKTGAYVNMKGAIIFVNILVFFFIVKKEMYFSLKFCVFFFGHSDV